MSFKNMNPLERQLLWDSLTAFNSRDVDEIQIMIQRLQLYFNNLPKDVVTVKCVEKVKREGFNERF